MYAVIFTLPTLFVLAYGAVAGASTGLVVGLILATFIRTRGIPRHLASWGTVTGAVAGLVLHLFVASDFGLFLLIGSFGSVPMSLAGNNISSPQLALLETAAVAIVGVLLGSICGRVVGQRLAARRTQLEQWILPRDGASNLEPHDIPLPLLTPAHLDWFGDRRRDADWLSRWHDAAPSFIPGTTPEHDMATDHYEAVIAPNADAGDFARSADRLMRYRFYPPAVSHAIGDHDIAGRAVQPGDRILQRAHLLALGSRSILDVLMVIAIHATVDEPRRKGLIYVTTAQHAGVGVWRMEVIWRADGALVLSMGGLARPAYGRLTGIWPFASFHRHLMRAFQHRAHQLGIEAFRRAVWEDMDEGSEHVQEEAT